MRCRKSWLIALAFGVSALGCRSANQAMVQTPVVPPPGAKVIKAEQANGGRKKDPKPDTCVMWGQNFEQSSQMAQNTPERRKAQLDRAKLAYEQALQKEPKNRDAMLGLATVLDKQGRYDQAVEAYQRGLKKYPHDAEFHHELGMCWARQKRWDPAIASLKKAVELAPDKATYSNLLGHTLARAERYTESFEHFKRTSGEAVAYCNLAMMLNHVGHKNESRQYAEAALQVNPNFPEAQALLAELSGKTNAETQARQ